MRERLKPEYAVAVVYVCAMFVNILDTTIVTVALPTLSKEFGTGTASIEWVVTGYLLSLAVWIPASGWIGDRIGTKKVFLFAIAVFTGASALCGFANSLGELVAFRILQGVGGGMLTPTGFAMLMRAFPPERRAAASRVLIIPTAMAPAMGPVVGGLLIDSLSWRWVFFVNLPVGLAAFVFGAIFLHEYKQEGTGRFDPAGFLLSGAGLALILFGLSQGPNHGWASPIAVVPLVTGAAAFAVLVYVELHIEHPMLQLRLIRERLFRTTMLVSTFSTGGFLGLLFVMPIFLQEARGVSAVQSGLTTFPEALGVLSFSQVAGRVYPIIGPRRMMSSALVCVGLLMLAFTQVDIGTNLWTIRGLMFLTGGCMSFSFIPLQAAGFARISPAQTGRASAIYNTQRQMSSALGVALLATVLSTLLPEPGSASFVAGEVDAFHGAFITAACLAFIGSLVALTIHDSDAAQTMRAKTEIVAIEPAA